MFQDSIFSIVLSMRWHSMKFRSLDWCDPRVLTAYKRPLFFSWADYLRSNNSRSSRCGLLALSISRVAVLDSSASKWIWKTSNYIVPPYECTNFRYIHYPPSRRIPTSAQILAAAGNNHTLWANGKLIGKGDDWETSQTYCVALNPDRNVFAAETVNLPACVPGSNPSAFISAIEVYYADGLSQIIGSGTNCANNATAGFQNSSFDDSNWLQAVAVANAGVPPWHEPSPQPPPSSLSITSATWIWTHEINTPGGNASVGRRAFRKKFSPAAC
ncbi:hypothetical protein AX15_003782 [Amanita polypyramis BW_CC]|nr:hypothetical protein AX15_003782 [Amanita polypyramis BW_CC]